MISEKVDISLDAQLWRKVGNVADAPRALIIVIDDLQNNSLSIRKGMEEPNALY